MKALAAPGARMLRSRAIGGVRLRLRERSHTVSRVRSLGGHPPELGSGGAMNFLDEILFRMTGRTPRGFFEELDAKGSSPMRMELDLPAALPEVGAGGVEMKSVTIGDTIPISSRGRPVTTNWTEARAVRDGLKVSVWVFACIYRLSKAMASVPWYVERRTRGAEDEWEPVRGRHPLADLINRPNPFWSRQDLFERWVFHLMLGGNGLLTKIRARGVPRELWLISPDYLKPIPVEREIIENYQFSPPGAPKELIPAGDVVHVMFTDPADPFWGLSPLQVLARTVDTDVAAEEWQLSALRNHAVPSGVLVFGKSLSGDQKTALEERVEARRAGPRNARKTLVLSGREATYHQLGLSPVEMDFLNSRKATREQICAVFSVPPPLVGIYEDATLANMNASRLIFWEETVIPLVVDLQEALNRSLAPEFGDDVRLVPDFTRVPALRELLVSLSETAKSFWSMGVPFEAINSRLGLGFDPFPGWDTSWIPSGVVPSDVLLFDAAEPDPAMTLPGEGDEGDGEGGEGDETTSDPLDDTDDDAGEVTENPLEQASAAILSIVERKAAE